MFRKALAGIFFIFLTASLFCQETSKSEQKLSLLFIGDIMGHDTQIWAAENTATHTYDYNEVFSYIKSEISEADVAIANFEVTLAGPPFMGYPRRGFISAQPGHLSNP